MTIEYNKAFPSTVIPRRVESKLKPGMILARDDKGCLVQYKAANKLGPTTILVSKPEEGMARVGFAGVYYAEELLLDGCQPDTLGRLEARGIHVMTRGGKELDAPKAKEKK